MSTHEDKKKKSSIGVLIAFLRASNPSPQERSQAVAAIMGRAPGEGSDWWHERLILARQQNPDAWRLLLKVCADSPEYEELRQLAPKT